MGGGAFFAPFVHVDRGGVCRISTLVHSRGGGGQKMSVFVHAQGIKTVHAKNGKILST